MLLSYPFWLRDCHADPNIIGSKIDFNGQAATVIGVLPHSFDFGAIFAPGTRADVFGPIVPQDIRTEGNTITLLGRLKPGVTIAQARAEAALLFPKLDFRKDHPEWKDKYEVTPRLSRNTSAASCIGRSSSCGPPSAWCCSLSASISPTSCSPVRRRAARSSHCEGRSAPAAAASSASCSRKACCSPAWAPLSVWASRMASRYGCSIKPRSRFHCSTTFTSTAPRSSGRSLIAVGTAVLFGLAPGLRMSSTNLQESLKDSAGHGASDSRRHDRLRSILVISEVALACVLLVGAGLLMRSFLRILDVNLGFQPTYAATIKVDFDDGGSDAKRTTIFQDVITRISALPGVQSAGIADNLPFARNRSWGTPHLLSTPDDQVNGQSSLVYMITPGYFAAMGIPVTGRDFSWEDTPLVRNEKREVTQGDPVVILNESTARRLFPNGDAIGHVIDASGKARIVGTIPDVHLTSVEGQPDSQVYYPQAQQDTEGAYLVLRSKVPPEQLASSVLHTLREINPAQAAVPYCPSSPSSITPSRRAASSCCSSAPLQDSACCSPRLASTASSPTRSPGKR